MKLLVPVILLVTFGWFRNLEYSPVFFSKKEIYHNDNISSGLPVELTDSPLIPKPRHLEKTTYDSKRNKLILFGGVELMNNKYVESPILWEWDHRDWAQINAGGPRGRRGHGMVYDKSKAETFILGGVTETGSGSDSLLYDVWSWNGRQWKKVNTICPVKFPDAEYDPGSERLLVYGNGRDTSKQNTGNEIFELWEYKSDRWKKLDNNGPNPDGPYQMAFNHSTETLVIPVWQGGTPMVWEWKNGQWNIITCNQNCPPPRTRFGLAYHELEKQVFLFGGRDTTDAKKSMNDFWTWNGVRWAKIEGPAAPPKAAMSLEYAKGKILCYGGVNNGLTNDLWEWDGKKWK